MSRDPNLFISHKHVDREIADVIRVFVEKWSHREVAVFQSSSAQAQAPELGRALSEELKGALWKAGIVVLVYTSDDQDWSWCMWECGVATNASSPDTRIIVFQCGTEQPRVFADQVRVDVRERADVRKFVRAFLTDAKLFPSYDRAVAPKFSPDGKEIEEAADELFALLQKVRPQADVAEWSAQPLIRLQLPLEFANGLGASGAVLDVAKVLDAARLSSIDQQARQIFGLADLNPGTTLGQLTQRWAKKQASNPSDWADEICAQIVRAATGEIPMLKWVYLREVNGDALYAPVLSRVRRVPAQRSMEFDINLLPYDNLTATPVVARMIPRADMVSVNWDENPPAGVRLVELADRFDNDRLSRIPFLSGAGQVRLIVHRSMIDRYLAKKARQLGRAASVDELTLAHFMADEPEMKRIVETGYEVVSRRARLADAQAKIAANKECQDVFVTEGGGRDEPVLGWITNVAIAQSASA